MLELENIMNTKEKVNQAFKLLRKTGYIAKQNFWCCQSCGWSAINNDYPDAEKVVFYHNQDNDSWNKNKELDHSLALAWAGNGAEIVDIIKSVGLNVEWDGSEDKRIMIQPEQQEQSA
jgi:hypothetical protein